MWSKISALHSIQKELCDHKRYVRILVRPRKWYWPWPKYERMDAETYREKLSSTAGGEVLESQEGFYAGSSLIGPIFGFWDEKPQKGFRSFRDLFRRFSH